MSDFFSTCPECDLEFHDLDKHRLAARLAEAERLLRMSLEMMEHAGWMGGFIPDIRKLLAGAQGSALPSQKEKAKCKRCGDTGWLDGDPVRGISEEPCGCDENWQE